jgi:hypothetical protein
VHFVGADPDKAHFVPLHMEEDLTLARFANGTEGIEYGPIVADNRYSHSSMMMPRSLSFPP